MTDRFTPHARESRDLGGPSGDHPTPQDIGQMRARGYDRSVIEEAAVKLAQTERLKALIRADFADVHLGSGIGLREAQAMDECASETQCAEYRASDEKADWRAIPADDLNECHSSLSFFDAEGMRFHLPAYLEADLDGLYDFNLLFTLTQSGAPETKFALLNGAQRAAVRAYLQSFEQRPELTRDHAAIRAALEGFWAE